jgi:AcrR family transcriptional regulator
MRNAKTTESSQAQKATSDVLLDTAERLFARDGIENVSIRQIVIHSGHGNQSGAHYHFGSRETLIRMLLERRMEITDALRHEELDRLIQKGQEHDVYAITQAGLRVLERVVKEFPWGRDYVIVAAQALFSPRIHLFTTLSAQAITGLERASTMTRAALPNLSVSCVKERLQIFRRHGTYEIARWLQEHEFNDSTQASFESMVQNLCEFSAAGIAAPSRSMKPLTKPSPKRSRALNP